MTTATCRIAVDGMHCPSCVSHIESLLAAHRLEDVVVSLFSGIVSFRHSPNFPLRTILTELESSGYRPISPDKATPGELAQHRSTPWLAKLLPSKRRERKRHRAVCEACRLEEEEAANEVEDDSSVEWTRSSFSVEGMTCSSCVASLKTGLQVDGVRSVSITLLPGRADVVHEASQIAVEAILELIADLGYDGQLEATEVVAKADTGRWRVRLSVQGMTCSSCTGSVKSTIAASMGTEGIAVDLMSGLATFTCNNEGDAEAIKNDINEMGFEATLLSNDKHAKEATKVEAATRNIRLRVDGMFCGECVAKVNSSMAALGEEQPGFAASIITLTFPFLAISYRPSSSFTARAIRDRIQDLGFDAVPAPLDSLEQRAAAARARERHGILLRLLISFAFVVPTFIIAIVGMSLLPMHHRFRRYWEAPVWGGAARGEIALWALATPVQFGVGSFFYARSWKSLRAVWRRRRGKATWRSVWLPRLFRWGSMDTLVALGTTLAYLSSVAFLALDVTDTSEMHAAQMGYFDTSVFLIFFILAGRYLEAWSKQHTGDAISELNKTKSSTGLLVGEATEQIDAAFIELGDTLLVPAGSAPPVDGVLLDSSSATSFDESALTGESRPVLKRAKDVIYAGSINTGPAAARMHVTSVLGTSMVDGIAAAVRDAMSRKAGLERIADAVTAIFVPAIVGIACFTLVVWLLRGYTGVLPVEWLDDGSRGGWTLFAIEFAVAVLVVACPCGIGLAAPTAQLVGVGIAARNGILPNGGGEAFQAYSRINAIVLDKTGTLTTSDFRVSDTSLLVDSMEERARVWTIAGAVEAASSHPLSRGIKTKCEEEANEATTRVDLVTSEEIAGRGLSATVSIEGERSEVIMGNEAFMRERGATYETEELQKRSERDMERWQGEAKSVVLLATRHEKDSTYRILGLFGLHDPPRAEAYDVVAELTRRNVDVWLCTGDNKATALAVAASVGIDADRIVAHAMPEDKRDLVQRLQRGRNGKRAVVAFCGDGINDSPALAQADAGIAMGSGSAVALKAAHFTLIGGSTPLLGLVTLCTLSRSTIRKIYVNFVYACVYNAALIPLAAGAFYSLGRTRLPPVWASLAMALSSISVVANSLLMRATYRVPKMVRDRLAV